MASPQLGNGFSRIANELLKAIMSYPFSGSQLRILLAVGRECYGRNGGRKLAPLSYGQIATATGLNLRTVQREVTRLLKGGALLRKICGVDRLYGLQKDYDRWKVREIGHSADGQSADGDLTVEESVNQPTEESVNQPTHKKKEERKKNKRAEKQHADPRFQPIVDHYLKRTGEVTGTKPFDLADGKNLRDLLARNPETPLTEITRWLDSAFNSTETYPLRPGFRMTEFCRHYSKYTRGPLLKGNHRGNGLGSKEGSLTQEELHRLTERKRERQSATA
jgi:hypothetical protein